MIKRTNKRGFTLIEIIVVLIIVGVLAAIALPALFSNIAHSKEAELALTLKNLSDEVYLCRVSHPTDLGYCDPTPRFPTIEAGLKNKYTLAYIDNGDGTFKIKADKN